MKKGSIDGKRDGEHTGVSFVQTSKAFAMDDTHCSFGQNNLTEYDKAIYTTLQCIWD